VQQGQAARRPQAGCAGKPIQILIKPNVMSERDQQQPKRPEQPYPGPQGIDKAPGEEPAQDPVNFVPETQKGKQQVDADLDDPQDTATDRQDV